MSDGSVLKPEEAGVPPTVTRNVPLKEAARMLGVTEAQAKQLVNQELLKERGPGLFNTADIERIATKHGLSLAEEATQVNIGLQRALATTMAVVRTAVTLAIAALVTYALIVAAFVVAYTYYPTQTADWISQKNPNPLQAILQPEGLLALNILRYAQPQVFKEVSQQIIVNPNDIFTVGRNGSLTPTGTIIIPNSSYLTIVSKALITNLNAQYLQGRVPGTAIGNIAIEGQVTNLADNSVDTSAIQDGAVTNVKLATITDANKVSGSAVQLSSGGGLANDSGLTLLKSCSDSEILKWNSADGAWECQADQGSAGSGITSIREGGVTVVSSATAINFGASDFDVSESPATVGNITVDYTNSKIVRSNQNETITGTWAFPSGTVLGTDTFTTNAITDSGPLTIKTTTNGALTLDSGTVGGVNLGTGANSKAVTVGSTTGTSSLSLNSGSGGIGLTGATTFNSTPITLAAGSTIIDMTGAGTLGINTTTNRAITTGTGLFTAGGALTATGALTADSSLTVDGNLATPKGTDYPTTGTQNNVNLGTGSFFRYTGVAGATFTGISGGTDGRLIRIANASSSTLTLNNQNGGSAASNQIITSSGGDLVIGSGSAVNLVYDPTTAVWRVVSFTPTASTLSGIAFVQGGNGFGTTAVLGTTDANPLNLITSGSTRFTLDAAAATLTGTGATTLTSTGTLSLTSATGLTNGVTINSGSTGPIQIGSDADNETIQVAAGAGVKNATFGSTNTTSTTTIAGGTGGIGIGDFNNTKQIRIGGNIFDGTDTVRISTNSTSADTLQFGNSNASTSFSLTGGNKWSITSGGVLTLIGAQANDITTTAGNSLTIDSGTTGALNLGTGANAKTITIGNTTGATAVNINAGSGGGTLVSASGFDLNPYGAAAGNTTELRFSELAANGSNYVGFKSPDALAGNVIWTLPNADGSNGTVLTTNGAGGLTWSSSGACPTCFTNGGNSFAATADLGTNDANDLNLRTNSTTRLTILTGGNVGIGDTSPAALLTVGSGDKFQVDANGNILKINNVTTSFPASQGTASTVLTNDGAGNLTWSSVGSGTASLDSITAAVGNATINNTNWNIDWEWSLTGATDGFDISEPGGAASTGTGYLLRAATIATSTAKPFSIGARGTTIFDTTAAGGLTIGDSATLNTPVTIQSGTGAINIGTDAIAHTITIGNVTGATSLVLNAGTGNIDIGTTAQARALNFGTGAAAQTVTVGSTNGGSTLTLDSGTGALNIGTSIAKTITLGNTTGATAVNINSGSGGINFGGAVTVLGANTFTTGTGTSTFNSTLINLAGNSTVIDMSGTGTLGLNTTNNAPITTGTGLFTTGGALTVDTTFTAIGNFLTPKGTDYVTTGTSNDTNFGSGSLFRYAGAGSATFTGIAGGADGRFIRIMNASGSDIIFNNADAGSAASNQILTGTGGNVTISPNISVGFQYDSGVSRWRLVVLPANSATVGTFAFVQGGNAFGATATLGTTDANLLSIITGGASRFQIAAGSSTLTGQGSTTLTSTSDISLTSAAGSALNVTSGTTGALTLDSGSTGDVVLGAGNSAKNIKIGGTGANVITIGNLQTGGSITLGNALTTGTITIGGTAQTGDLTLGSSSGINNLFIANGSGATTLNLANIQTGGAVNIGAGMTTGTVTIGGTGAQTGTLTFGGGTGAQTVNLGTGGTGIKTINLGTGSAANIISIGTTQNGGSIALGSAMTTGTIDIGNSSNAMTGTINIGGSTGAQTLNFGGGSTGIKTINIGGGTAANVIAIGNAQTGGSLSLGGSMTSGTITIGGTSQSGTVTISGTGSTGITNINAGTGGLNLLTGTTGNISIASGTTGSVTLDSGTTGNVNLGTGANAKTVAIGNVTGATAVNINSGTGNVNFTVGPTSSSGKVQIGNSGTATPDLLVLDNGTADPTGVNGGMYYNTSTAKFRCYQNSAWTNCIGGDKIASLQTSDQPSVTTTLANTSMQFSIGASESWVFKAHLFVTNANSANPDWKGAILGPALNTCSVQTSGSEAVGAVFPQSVSTNCTTPTAMVNNNINADGNNGFDVWIQGIITGGGTAGTVTVQFAQNTLDAAHALTVKAGSFLMAYKVNGADLAEAYASRDSTIQPGDVVSVDNSLTNGAQKSAKPYDSSVLGVVSTNPGIVIGDATSGSVLVALSGRIPVKVSTENGPIRAGDYLTTSTLPGVAMKATKAGAIIGTAMEDYWSDGIGSVMVFAKNGTSGGTSIANLIPGVTEGDVGQLLLSQMVNQNIVTPQLADLSDIVTDRIAAGVEIITPKLTAKDINLTGSLSLRDADGNETVRIDSLGNATFTGVIKADSIEARQIKGLALLTNSISTLEDKVGELATTSATPAPTAMPLSIADLINGLFKTAAEFFGNVIFHSNVFFAGRPTFNKDTAGFATLTSGQNEVEIKFDKEYVSVPVVTASVNLVGGVSVSDVPSYAVYDISTKGFKIKTSRGAGFDMQFSWIALAVKDANTSQGQVGGASTVNPATPAPTAEPSASPSPVESPVPSASPIESAAPTEVPTPAATP